MALPGLLLAKGQATPGALSWTPMTRLPPATHPALAQAGTNPLLAGTSLHSPSPLLKQGLGKKLDLTNY